MIKTYSLKALEKAINYALRLDEALPTKMSKLQGKTIELNISPLEIRFFILFLDNGLELQPSFVGRVDTIIHSSPLGLIRLSFLPASQARSVFNDKIRISGDVELGHEVKKLFDGLDLDWEGHLAQFTGDVCAYQIGSLVRRVGQFQQEVIQSLRQNAQEYLQEEKQLFPSREETADFFDDVDEVRLEVDRIEAQLKLLKGSKAQ